MRDRVALARVLIDAGALELRTDPEDWFTWSSGKRAPAYCDNRLLCGQPGPRGVIADALAEAIRTRFADAEVVAGTATAGIPHAAWVAERLDLPMCYVRGEAKGHGRGKRIEGLALGGARVVLVEDTVSLGGSALAALDALEQEGGKVVGIQAIYSWDFPAAAEKLDPRTPWQALTDYPALLEALDLDSDQRALLERWRTQG